MKALLVICLLSIVSHLCLAQDAAIDVPVVAPGTDTATVFVSNLVSYTSKNSKIVLNWKDNIGLGVDFVTVERSGNGRDFEVVAVLKQSSPTDENSWTDDVPVKGRSLYRLKFTGKDGTIQYSKVISATIAGDISFKFYPNPVDNILIVRSETPLDIQIIDGSGKVRASQSKLQGLQTINVSTLEKGLYVLRIYNHITGNTSQEKLLKN
jgi:hypothetical protein